VVEGDDTAADDLRLAELVDEELLRCAAADGRALVSEDAKDLGRIVRQWAAAGGHHAGLVLTSTRRFHRGGVAYPENLIASLTRSLDSPPEKEHDWCIGSSDTLTSCVSSGCSVRGNAPLKRK
jgi:hypothetical protein